MALTKGANGTTRPSANVPYLKAEWFIFIAKRVPSRQNKYLGCKLMCEFTSRGHSLKRYFENLNYQID